MKVMVIGSNLLEMEEGMRGGGEGLRRERRLGRGMTKNAPFAGRFSLRRYISRLHSPPGAEQWSHHRVIDLKRI